MEKTMCYQSAIITIIFIVSVFMVVKDYDYIVVFKLQKT